MSKVQRRLITRSSSGLPTAVVPSRVLVLEQDTLTDRSIAAGLAQSEFVSQSVASFDEAVQVARNGLPVAAFLCSVSGIDLHAREKLELLRGLRNTLSMLSIATIGPGQHALIPEIVAGGFDDVLVKPIDVRALLIRLRARQQRTVERGALGLASALREAMRHPIGGEVVVRQNTQVGRIHVASREIVWIHCSHLGSGLQEILHHAALTLEKADISNLVEEAKRTGRNFAEILVDWKLVEETTIRFAIQKLIGARLKDLLEMDDSRSIFLPTERVFKARFAFQPKEIVETNSFSEFPPEADTPDNLEPLQRAVAETDIEAQRLLEQLGVLDGARLVLVVDANRGLTLAHSGPLPDPTMVWSLIAIATDSADPQVAEVIVTTEQTFTIVKKTTNRSGVYVVVSFDSPATNLALARKMLGQLL